MQGDLPLLTLIDYCALNGDKVMDIVHGAGWTLEMATAVLQLGLACVESGRRAAAERPTVAACITQLETIASKAGHTSQSGLAPRQPIASEVRAATRQASAREAQRQRDRQQQQASEREARRQRDREQVQRELREKQSSEHEAQRLRQLDREQAAKREEERRAREAADQLARIARARQPVVAPPRTAPSQHPVAARARTVPQAPVTERFNRLSMENRSFEQLQRQA